MIHVIIIIYIIIVFKELIYLLLSQANNQTSLILLLRSKISLVTRDFGFAWQTNHAFCAHPTDHPVICLHDRVIFVWPCNGYAWKKQNKTTNIKKNIENFIGVSNRHKQSHMRNRDCLNVIFQDMGNKYWVANWTIERCFSPYKGFSPVEW